MEKQEVMFSWTIPTETNKLSYFTRFSELKLFTYINEFELMMGTFIEKSVNIDYIIYRVIKTSKNSVIRLLKTIKNSWENIRGETNTRYNSS